MKYTLSDNKQLFNVKAIAAAGQTPDQIADNEFAMIDVSTGQTVKPASFSALPDEFRFVSKVNGKYYYSFDTIKKECCKIKDATAIAAQDALPNVWEATIDHCECIEGFVFRMTIADTGDNRLDDSMDIAVGVRPAELGCECNSGNHLTTYENNLITADLVSKLAGADVYKAYAGVDAAGLATTQPSAVGVLWDDAGVLKVSDTTTTSVVVGTVGSTYAEITDMATYLTTVKGINTDTNTTNNGAMLKVVIEGTVPATYDYADIDVSYKYPRGFILQPAIEINGDVAIAFTETQEAQFAIGEGADLRAEEFDCMSLYTNLNYYPQLSDGATNPALKYQFENGKDYNVVTFEFLSEKSGLDAVSEDTYKKFSVLLGTESTAIFADLKDFFDL